MHEKGLQVNKCYGTMQYDYRHNTRTQADQLSVTVKLVKGLFVLYRNGVDCKVSWQCHFRVMPQGKQLHQEDTTTEKKLCVSGLQP